MSKIFDVSELGIEDCKIDTEQLKGFFNKKTFKDGKPKKLAEDLADNLPFLVIWWFNHKKSRENDKAEGEIVNLFTKKKFIKPLSIYISKVAVSKKDKKKDKGYKYPEGFLTLLMDIRANVYNRMKSASAVAKNNAEAAQTKRSAIVEKDLENKEYSSSIMREIDDMIHILAKPMTRECVDAGFEHEYAEMLAPAFVKAKYLNKKNVYKYIQRFNSTLMNIQKVGTTPTAEGWTNMIGASLGDPEDGPMSIAALYEEFFKNCDREVFIEGIIAILLEYRNENLINNNPAVAGLTNCINTVILDLIEGKTVINYTNGKEKDKKVRLSEKESRKIIKKYIERRYATILKGGDCPRRIVFRNLDAEKYPLITKWYSEYNDGVIEDSIEAYNQPKQLTNGNNNNQNNNCRNNNQNRNNNQHR